MRDGIRRLSIFASNVSAISNRDNPFALSAFTKALLLFTQMDRSRSVTLVIGLLAWTVQSPSG